nr:MAG TPA: hypothetical protein [Caudoviricetes sp.]
MLLTPFKLSSQALPSLMLKKGGFNGRSFF